MAEWGIEHRLDDEQRAACHEELAQYPELLALELAARNNRVPTGQSRYLYRLVDREAVEHLLVVSCGLDSAIVGESQTLGQVRDALRQGLAARWIGRVISTLFRQAVTTGKRARTEAGIGRNAASTGSAAVEVARRRFGDLSSARRG